MANQRWRMRLLALGAMTLSLVTTNRLAAQTQPTTHTLTVANAKESIDAKGRIILVGNVKGDLPGVLTLALTVGPSGTITSGEWALNVSYIKFGAPEVNGDGDESESLVQLGVLKGTVAAGVAGRATNGLAIALNGLQLNVTGATVQFAKTTKGTGTFNGSSLNSQTASSASLSITF